MEGYRLMMQGRFPAFEGDNAGLKRIVVNPVIVLFRNCKDSSEFLKLRDTENMSS
jgi:hypothetical protein